MFKLVRNLTFWWPVKVIEPDPFNPGKTIEYQFEAEFEILDRDEDKRVKAKRAELLARLSKDSSETNIAQVEAELEALDEGSFRRAIRNWRNIGDEDGNPLVFTEETFAAALKHDRVRAGLVKAYRDAVSQDGARLGN